MGEGKVREWDRTSFSSTSSRDGPSSGFSSFSSPFFFRTNPGGRECLLKEKKRESGRRE
jgi:hypothetical protein